MNHPKQVLYWRPSPSESWRLGHVSTPGTSPELAQAHAELLTVALQHVGCPAAEVRVGTTLT